MASSFEAAADTLYAAPLKEFISERKRLAAELKEDDKAAAAALLKLTRPGQSAWAINQLFRQEKADWEKLLAASARIRAGELAAAGEQRVVIAGLRAKAESLLRGEGASASDQMLARIETNLRSIVATGWGDDPPGRLVEDRSEPGFDALAGFAALASSAPVERNFTLGPAQAPGDRCATLDPEAQTRPKEDTEAEALAKKKAEARRQARAAERQILSTEVNARAQALAVCQQRVEHAQAALERARSALSEAERAHAQSVEKHGEVGRALQAARQQLADFDAAQ